LRISRKASLRGMRRVKKRSRFLLGSRGDSNCANRYSRAWMGGLTDSGRKNRGRGTANAILPDIVQLIILARWGESILRGGGWPVDDSRVDQDLERKTNSSPSHCSGPGKCYLGIATGIEGGFSVRRQCKEKLGWRANQGSRRLKLAPNGKCYERNHSNAHCARMLPRRLSRKTRGQKT